MAIRKRKPVIFYSAHFAESVPRAVASVALVNSPLCEPRSLPLAVLIARVKHTGGEKFSFTPPAADVTTVEGGHNPLKSLLRNPGVFPSLTYALREVYGLTAVASEVCAPANISSAVNGLHFEYEDYRKMLRIFFSTLTFLL